MPIDSSTRAQIQEFISLGKTEEALSLLAEITSDAVLLQSRFNGAKRQYSMGLIDFSEWSRTQAQINYAALEMMNVNSANILRDGDRPLPDAPMPGTSTPQPSVFLIFDEEAEADSSAAMRIRDFLEGNGVRVNTAEDIAFGADIRGAITNAIKTSNLALAVISAQSLRASWEHDDKPLNIVLDRISENYVIPVSLDRSVLDPDFYFESLDYLNERIKKWGGYVQKAIKLGEDSRGLQVELNRLELAKSQLSLIIEKLKNVRMVNLSRTGAQNDQAFEQDMRQILRRLNIES